jgi:DNA mismatch repair protein MSH5
MNDSFIYAKNVRHPLVELNVENSIFVPNEIKTGVCSTLSEFKSDIQSNNKIKVVTGPNVTNMCLCVVSFNNINLFKKASGKTVYIKSVALTLFMSMIGSYVPSVEAYIGDFDRIFTRLNSDETVAIQLSSFSIDAKQIAESINGSSSKSLILVDEFGKGTNELDGQSLVAALIKYWSDMPNMTSPHIFFSTHFYEILSRFETIDSLKEKNNLNIDYLTFNFMIDKDELKHELNKTILKEKLIYLFTLQKGVTKSSHAIQIASRIGIDDSIIQRANQIYDVIKGKLSRSNSVSLNEIVETNNTKIIFDR